MANVDENLTDKEEEIKHYKHGVLPPQHSGGPLGLGDPNDRSLRYVEQEILIPQKMRDKAKKEKCVEVVKAFEDCCKEAGFSMVVKCQKENGELQSCLGKWYNDTEFRKKCTEEYLDERSEYRRTGVKKISRRKESATF
ncbi:COX assembly mitochondrial protein homolog [Limulus polyphemus]|uniref:COX assembly mitochondrial protein n=1 Tax=Limulus polyphemus TaxID=6850 RepID=A0ABM1C1K1_LIMPO|nr:COX assembly mitochondrial protein homolog [Limulus polyphemus]